MTTEQLTPSINIEDEMCQSYMDYAMSVIIGRALPDVRDGMKPVQRRVLYAMMGEGLVSNKKHSKCAGVVGEVLKRLHPHGDSSVYEALVRLAQPWTLRYPLVDGQGNFGSVDGDPAAAYRYTECRMTAIAEKLLEDIDKDTVDFIPNFDDSNIEPVVLPAAIPNLLVNGADGIAVGMATHIPPHNLAEVVNGVVAYLEDPTIDTLGMMKHIPGPDFPTGGIIYGRSLISSAYHTGKGIFQIRAKTAIENIKSGNREAEAIVVTEIPFQVNKARLIEKIAELVNEKLIDGISRLRDESDRVGMRIVVELKREATAEIVLNQLFKLTPLQSSFGIINLAIVEGKPLVCSITQMIGYFVDHRRDVVVRRTQFDLRKAQERMHILEGYRIALLNLDEVIQLIKRSQTPVEAKSNLCTRFSLSDIQSQAILELTLKKLTGMERLAVEQEHKELAAEIERLLLILGDSKKVDEIITKELIAVRDQFADARRTQIIDDADEINIEDLIEDEEMVVTISHKGYMKRTATSVYRAQRRGGKGVSGASQKDEDDFVEHLFVTSTKSDLLVFTSLGRVYWMKVYEIPESGRTARGRAIVNLLNLKEGELVAAILPVKEFVENQFVFMATKQGVVKKLELMDFSRSRKGGIIACTLDQNDALVGVGVTLGDDEILLATKSGMSIRFSESDVRAMGRNARGVRGISLEGGDVVVSMTVAPKAIPATESAAASKVATTLLTVCEQGYGKRTSLEDYRAQNRGGKGLIDIQTEDRNGPVVGAVAVCDDTGLMLITTSGKIIRTVASGVSIIGRNTKGVKLIDLDENEKVVAVAPIVAEVDGEENV